MISKKKLSLKKLLKAVLKTFYLIYALYKIKERLKASAEKRNIFFNSSSKSVQKLF